MSAFPLNSYTIFLYNITCETICQHLIYKIKKNCKSIFFYFILVKIIKI